MAKWDVAVVGAGPAGAWAARELSVRGLRVLLADPSHPREKPCGGGVTDRALALVANAPGVAHLPRVRIASARFLNGAHARPHGDAAVNLAHGRGLVVASRRAFDSLLLDAAERAGATLVRHRIVDVAISDAGARLAANSGETYEASFLIGADGANGLVRRRLLGRFARSQISIATGFFVHGASGDTVDIEFVDDPPGYIWNFPRPDHLAIGICAQADAGVTADTLRDRVAIWIRQNGLAKGATLQPYSWPIPSLSASDFESLRLSGSRWMLIGDAAGLVDPITREGIFFALQSASFAAAALADGGPACYEERVRDDIGSELLRAAQLKAGFFTPRFTRLLIDALTASARVREVMADLIAGAQGYRGLERRLAGTFEIGLAARLAWYALRRT